MMPMIMAQIVNPIIEDVEDSTDLDKSDEDEELKKYFRARGLPNWMKFGWLR